MSDVTKRAMLVERACLLDELHARRAVPARVAPGPVDRSVRAAVAWLEQREVARTVAGRER